MEPAEPRHGSQSQGSQRTDLEYFLRIRAPELLRQHASNIILGLLILAAVGMFLYTRSRNKAAVAVAADQNTAIAYDYATQARELLASPVPAPEQAQERVRQALLAADYVIESEASPLQKANALLAKADVFWALANAPARATATTQPVTGFQAKQPEAYLADADGAYTEILSRYADQRDAATQARLGLAAIAENRRDYGKAGEWYAQVKDDASVREAYRKIATARLTMLEQLKRPYALAAPSTQSSSQPASQPAATLPGADLLGEVTTLAPLEPTTRGAPSELAVPATVPATQPTTQP